MLDAIIDKITSDASTELFFLFSGSIILYAFQKSYKRLKDIKYKRKLRLEISSYKKRKDAINVVDLANGDPEFEKSNIFSREVSIFGEHRSLFIAMPNHIKDKITSREREADYMDSQLSKFYPDISFNGKCNFEDIAELTGITELPELIEKHKAIVGEMFLESKDGLIFNGEKYGVFNLKFTRFGDQEKPGVEIDLFKTDYFTHRVFRSIYHELKKKDHPICSAGISDFLKYKPFFTSFGINTLLICEGSRGKEVILSKRSSRVHGSVPKYHITMNEGLSQTDKDPFGRVDLELCFKRGLLEELGINEKLYQHGVKASFYDFFLEKNNFEIGLSSVFELDLDYEKDVEPLIARDKHLEVDSFIAIPLKSKDIEKFISSYDFVPHGLYVLERVLLRENVSIAKSITNASTRTR
ncbi:hypothetical protein [uncultured Pseudomonas sp.]|uniref:hypothetical protein n=1 Tax=uncultured Pseudomonas sp. TaxID=114707 RepID=UPI001DB16676|nr:hypothetical protein [uncultured Pseudomonas sp.]MBU1833017.1 hypothetical protein [Gammaproteobacteria bacterium]